MEHDPFFSAMHGVIDGAVGRLTARGIPRTAEVRASGNDLAAQNDEPEPGDLTEKDLAEIDRQFEIRKDSGAARDEREQAAHWQQRNVEDFIGRGS